MPSYYTKICYLRAFVARYHRLPSQGTGAWLARRMSTVGGSEMSVITGESKYSNMSKLVRNKLGWDTFKGNAATQWGKAFEPVVQEYLQYKFKCQIYETGSLPGCIPHTSYSPDGFAVVKRNVVSELVANGDIPTHDIPEVPLDKYSNIDNALNIESILDADRDSAEVASNSANVLFEIKSPHRRIPNGKIPIDYVSQPLSGLCHFPWVDIAYFVDAAFRKCTMEQLSGNGYDNVYHRDNKPYDKCAAKGLIGIYCKKIPYANIANITPVDYGYASMSVFDRLTKQLDKGEVSAYYFHMWDNDKSNHIEQFEEFRAYCEEANYRMCGYIPWKMCDVRIVPVQRQPNYVQNYQREINKVVEIINRIKSASDPKAEYAAIFNDKKDPEVTSINAAEEFGDNLSMHEIFAGRSLD